MKTKAWILLASHLLMVAPWSALTQTTFTKITTDPIVNDVGSWAGCAWGDYDHDGFIDLFITSTAMGGG
jgi:hypothetical protein